MNDRFFGMHWMLATPFDANEEVDTSSITRLVRKAREAGCAGVVALGVTGEAARLTDQERFRVTVKVIESSSGMSVTVGTSASSTKVAAARSKEAQNIGASAVMVAPPQMAKANLDVVFDHYARIAGAIDIPIVVQDHPRATGVSMPPSFIARLAENIPAARYLKLEDPPTPPKISVIQDMVGSKIGIFGGLGGVFLLDELSRGSIGAMTGFAYPEVLANVIGLMADDDRRKAERIFYEYLPLILFESQEGIGLSIRKEALYHRGLIDTPKVRHPGLPVTDATRKELLHLIDTLALE